ncbi:hypothetical protein CRUP_004977 [Coryphaenoides rupestris]|nr:hypothetical protein CRUP_004977 [Coryphaenoides rupestris]
MTSPLHSRPCRAVLFCALLEGREVDTVVVEGSRELHSLSNLQPDTEYIVTVIPLYQINTEGPPATARFKIGGPVQNQSFPKSTTRYVLSGLQPGTEYLITLYTLYEGREEATPASTSSAGDQPVGRVSNLRVVEYLGSTETRSVPGNQTTLDLRDLMPGVSYGVSVTALVGERAGDPVTVLIKPGERAAPLTRLVRATGGGADEEQFRVLGPEVTTFTIEGLQPDGPLLVGVAAMAGQRVGEAVTLSSRTNANGGGGGGITGLRVDNRSSQRISISWSPASRATGYRVVWRRGDGVEATRSVAGNTTSYSIGGLQADSAYRVSVYTLAGSREGSPVSLNVRTESDQFVVGTVTSLQVQEAHGGVIRVTWVGVQGATSYRVSWRRVDGGEQLRRVVGGDVTSVDLDQLDPGAQYEVQVMALVQNREGSPVSVRVTTPALNPTPPTLVVTTLRVAEVTETSVLLGWIPVPGATGYYLSWRRDSDTSQGQSITLPTSSTSYRVQGLRLGQRASLATPLRTLLTSAAGSLMTIGARDSQVGIVVYSARPKVWFLLNRHGNKETLLQEILSTPFDDTSGNNIGQALTFARQFLLTSSAGRRPRVPGTVVIISDSKSSDNITTPASTIKASGVTVLAVGVGRADQEELRRAVTDQSPQNLLYTRDAGQLDTLHSDLADLLCGIARIPEGRDGLPGREGLRGPEGRQGPPGRTEGPSGGVRGEKGERGCLDGLDRLEVPGRLADRASPVSEEIRWASPGLPGRDGAKGFIGSPGNPGQDGRPGVPGTPGISIKGLPGVGSGVALKGDKGSLGASGPVGPQGLRGLVGTTGAKGDKVGRNDRGPSWARVRKGCQVRQAERESQGTGVRGGLPGRSAARATGASWGRTGPKETEATGDRLGKLGRGVYRGPADHKGKRGMRERAESPAEVVHPALEPRASLELKESSEIGETQVTPEREGRTAGQDSRARTASLGSRACRVSLDDWGRRETPETQGRAGETAVPGLPEPGEIREMRGLKALPDQQGRWLTSSRSSEESEERRGTPVTQESMAARGHRACRAVPACRGYGAWRGNADPREQGGSEVLLAWMDAPVQMVNRGQSDPPASRVFQASGGTQGPPGPTGPPGHLGTPGRDGLKGDRGTVGPSGPAGVAGLPGVPGNIGPPGQVVYMKGAQVPPVAGPQGPPGAPGDRGPHGAKGDTGDPGEDGAPGRPGTAVDVQKALSGLGIPVSDLKVMVDRKDIPVAAPVKAQKGQQGDVGEPGNRGPTGLDGLRGLAGDKGPKGDQGERGPVGATGPTGRAIGERGSEGPPGQAGERGKPGIPGSPGRAGELGEAGRPGDKGFAGLSGAKGDRGEAGERGRDGPQGSSGEPGKPGQDGKPVS